MAMRVNKSVKYQKNKRKKRRNERVYKKEFAVEKKRNLVKYN